MPSLAPKSGQSWTDDELSELKRLDAMCLKVDYWILEFGNSDAGDPWCIVFDYRRQRAVVHIGRIDRRYVTAFPVERRCMWVATLEAAIDIALREIRLLYHL